MVVHVEPRRVSGGRPPACLGLHDLARQNDLSENTTQGSGLIAPAKVRERVDRMARGVDAAAAVGARDGMRLDRVGEGILLAATAGDRSSARKPETVVDDRREPQAVRRLAHLPRSPAQSGRAAHQTLTIRGRRAW